jgi:cyclase
VRVIPLLLLQDGGLVKSIRFKKQVYVGDPINAVRIFNEKEVDELVLLDISASAEKRPPDFARIKEIAGEAFMPMAYGGGISQLDEIKKLINLGVEKVVLNRAAYTKTELISEAAAWAGSQSIVVSIDVKKNWLGKQKVYIHQGKKETELEPLEFAKRAENAGAGEILLNSIDRDGSYEGYDLELIGKLSKALTIPLVAVGGAGRMEDFYPAIERGASAVAAGSLFVFQGPHKAVLINYPSQEELKEKLFLKL